MGIWSQMRTHVERYVGRRTAEFQGTVIIFMCLNELIKSGGPDQWTTINLSGEIPEPDIQNMRNFAEYISFLPRVLIIGPGKAATWKLPEIFDTMAGEMLEILRGAGHPILNPYHLWNPLPRRDQMHFANTDQVKMCTYRIAWEG